MYLNDLTFFYYPLPLCLRVVSLQQSPSTSDVINPAGAYQGGIAALAAFVRTIGRQTVVKLRSPRYALSKRFAFRQKEISLHRRKIGRAAADNSSRGKSYSKTNGGERSNAATQSTSTPQALHPFELQAGNAIFSGWV